MAKQTFTAGQVLTAAQMTSLQANDYNWSTSAKTASYTLVAADAGTTITMTNASATTITVNTSLFTAGDRVAIINLGAGATTITAGTATVNSAGSLVLPQYASGTLWFSSASAAIFIPDDRTVSTGLVYITSATVTANTVLAVNNVFSSTYLNYFMTYSNLTTSSGGNVSLQFSAGGTANSAANYQIGSWRVAYAAGAGNAGGFAANQTTFTAVITDTSTTESFGSMYFFSPFTTTQTGLNSSSSGGNQACWTNGIHTGSNSFDGIKLTATQNMTGTFRFYGVANS